MNQIASNEYTFVRNNSLQDTAEFSALSLRHPTSCTVSNYKSNRYSNILPNEETRVFIKPTPDHPSDFINANHVRYEDPATNFRSKPYILAQAPMPSTFNSFWLMVWQQKADKKKEIRTGQMQM